MLEHVPASVKIVRHVEKRMICRECDTTVAGQMPTLPIERGKPGPGLLAHIMIGENLELIEEITANSDNITEANWFTSAMAVKMARRI